MSDDFDYYESELFECSVCESYYCPCCGCDCWYLDDEDDEDEQEEAY